MRFSRLAPLVLALLILPVAVVFMPGPRRALGRLVTWFERRTPAGAPASPIPASLEGARLPALPRLDAWLNGPPQTADSLAGRVSVIVIWRDTDPQSLWQLLYAQTWHEQLARLGLEVIGVHVPEFAFAADSSVPAAAIRRLGVTFPIALDPGLRTMNVFGPHAGGSRTLVVDRGGRVVLDQRGEGTPMAADRAIVRAVMRLGSDPPTPVRGGGGPAPHESVHLGSARVASGPLVGATTGQAQFFPALFRHEVEGESWAPQPVGLWTPGADGVTAARGGAATMMALSYHGQVLGAVMSSPPKERTRVWILRDERWLERGDAGFDVRFDERGASYVLVDRPRLYTLVLRGDGDHVIKLSPEQPGLTIYAFTFVPGPHDSLGSRKT